MTLGSLALTTDRLSRDGAQVPLANVTFVPYCDSEIDSIKYLKYVLTDDHSGIEKPAAIVMETVQAEGGINIADEKWLIDIRDICDENDILLIVDDIQVGNGRTGFFFSFERAGIVPDMVILSKSISGFGNPMSLLLVKPELDIFAPAEHNGTFRGNQISFVGATAAIRYFVSHNLDKEVKRKAKIVESYINDNILSAFDKITARGIGLIWGIDFSGIDNGIALECVHKAFEKGVICEVCGRHDSVLKIMPPLTIEDEVLLEGLSKLRDVIQDCCGEPI